MSETLSKFDKLKRPKTYAALFLASVALAGCGGDRISAKTQKIGPCGERDYNKPASEDSSKSIEITRAVDSARNYVLKLQQRALRNGGEISVPRYTNGHGDVTEIKATRDDLDLRFDRSSGWYNDPIVDHVRFPIKGDSVELSSGAITCFDNQGNLTVNGTYESLKQYTLQTSALDQLN